MLEPIIMSRQGLLQEQGLIATIRFM